MPLRHALILILSIALLISATTSSARAKSETRAEPSPSCNPYIATLGAAFMSERKDSDGNPIVPQYAFSLSLYPERAKSMGVAARTQIRVTISPNRNAPFVYLLNGLGSPSDSGYGRWLMDFLHQMGFTVVSLPSTFSDVDAYAFSRYLRPGLSSTDVPDVMALLIAAQKKMADYGYRATSNTLMGVSLGAFQGAVIQADPRFRAMFSKYVLINPPLDLRYGLAVLDSFARGQEPGGASDRDAMLESLRDRLAETGTPAAQGFGDDQLKTFIGIYLRLAVQDMAVASQRFQEDNVFGSGPGDGRRFESRFWTIQNYFDRIAFPFYSRLFADSGKKLDLDRELSIWPHLREAPAPDRVLILHSQDDFISNPKDLPLLKKLRTKAVVSSCGGHVGALPYRVFTVPLANFLRSP